jgi:hypothetical protein
MIFGADSQLNISSQYNFVCAQSMCTIKNLRGKKRGKKKTEVTAVSLVPYLIPVKHLGSSSFP